MNSNLLKQKALDFIADKEMIEDFLNYTEDFYIPREQERMLKEKQTESRKRRFRESIKSAFEDEEELKNDLHL